MLPHIPKIIGEEDNRALDDFPTLDDVHKVIEEMDEYSTAGPDGFNGCFYKSFWDIIKTDLFEAVLGFFAGFDCSRSWTSTLIIHVPKVEPPSEFKQLRSISLCNFSSKILSKLCVIDWALFSKKLSHQNRVVFLKEG